MSSGPPLLRAARTLVFLACLVPAAQLLCGACGWFGISLGADPVKHLEHAAGLTALNLLLLTLAVTPVRQLLQLPQLLRLRRMLGLFTFAYALLHFLIYAVLDLELDPRHIGADLAKRPYLTLGFLALLLLVPLAVTSTDRAMRRLGRRWSRLHQLVYAVAVLGVWHFYWQVKRDVREPLIYAAVLAVLLGYRAVGPLRRQAAALTSTSAPATARERT